MKCPNCGHDGVKRINFVEWCPMCGAVLVGTKVYIPYETDWRREEEDGYDTEDVA